MAGKSMKKSSTAVAKRSSETAKTKSSVSSQSRAVKAPAPSARLKAGEEKGVNKKTPATAKAPKRMPPSRSMTLRKIMLGKRVKIMKEIQDQLGQSLTEEQQRRFESAMDSGDQALLDLEREMGISLQEKRNRERQMIDEALVSLEEGTYGICVECDAEISEKRLAVILFARLCVECQEKIELFEKIERGEQRV